MAKKFSKYNVYQGCTNMCSMKEAVAEIDMGKVSASTLHQLEARIELYNELFSGFGNTDEQTEAFKKKRNNILSGLSKAEQKEYAENLQNEISDRYDEANKEYLMRVNSIDLNSVAGKESGTPAFDRKKVEQEDTKYKMTRYGKLTNLPLPTEYRCNDDGAFIYSKTEGDFVRICEPISIRSLNSDDETGKEYIELEYYNKKKSPAVKTICLEATELAAGKYAQLIGRGMIIDTPRLFTKYLNDLRTYGDRTGKIVHKQAATSYGFPTLDDGSLDFSKFIGVDDDCKILSLDAYEAYDKVIFQQKGTVEGFIEFLEAVSEGKYEIDFQLTVAASLSGITQAYINETSHRLAPPAYLFIGRSSIGKSLLGSIANNIWAGIGGKNLLISSGSSIAFSAAWKDHLAYLPFIIEDVQDLMNKGEDGVKGITEIIFAHSNGQSDGRACTNGEIRNNNKKWYNALIAYNENDCFTHNSSITGGASARITVINLNIELEDRWLTENDPNSYWNKEKQNAGVLGAAFIIAMRNKTQDEICERFYQIAAELKDLGVQEKQANSLAILIQTDELAREFGLVPARWEPLTAKRLTDWIGVKVIPDASTELYRLICETVIRDVSYVPNDDEGFKRALKAGRTEQEIFESRSKEKEEVRGRILYQKKDSAGNYVEGTRESHDRALLLIPKLQLKQLIDHIVKASGIIGANFDPRTWAVNGWLIPAKTGYVHKDSFHISITYARSSKHRESYYAIILQEDTEGDTDFESTVPPAAVPAPVDPKEFEANCLKTLQASLAEGIKFNRKICEECTREQCRYVQERNA